MKTTFPLSTLAIPACVVTFVFSATAYAQTPIPVAAVNRSTPVSFENEILPIFRRSCLACHSASEGYGELVLETPQTIAKGGDTGAAVVPGKGADSLLLKVAAHQTEPVMPPPDNDVAAKTLTSQELGLVKLWIDQGAVGSALSDIISPQRWRPLPSGNHPIFAVAVTPDGQFAACGRANQIFIYHVPTGRLMTRLNDPSLQATGTDKRPGVAHLDVVQSLAFNRQGDLLASGGFRTVKLWRYPRDVQRLTLNAATDTVTAVAVSPDRKLAATGAADNTIKLWDLESGEQQASLAGHTAGVTGLRFSHDGERLCSSSADKTIRVWSVADASLLGRIDTPTEVAALTSVVEKIPKAESAETAASAETAETDTAAGEASADVQTAEEAPTPETEPATEAEPEFDIFEQIASGGGDNQIRIWNIPKTLPQPLADTPENTNVLAVSPDRKRLALANAAGVVRVINVDDGELIHTWQAHDGPIGGIAFRPVIEPPPAEEGAPLATPPSDEDTEPQPLTPEPLTPEPQLATAGADGTLRIWNFQTGEAAAVLRGSLSPLECVAFSPDGKQLVAGAADGSTTVWQLDAAPPRALELPSESPAAAVAVSRDGKRLATAGASDGRPAIFVVDLTSGTTTHTLLGHDAPIHALAFNADATRVASGSEDQTARVWDLSDPKFSEIARFAGHESAVDAVAFSSDGQQVVSGAVNHTVKVWGVADSLEIRDFPGHTAPVVDVAMTSANQPVSAAGDKTVRIWNPADGQIVRTITDAAAITAMALSPDSARIAVSGSDNQVRIYQAADGALLHTLTGHQGAVGSLAFSLDNSRLVSAAADNTAIVWNAADGRLLEILPVGEGISTATCGPNANTVLLSKAVGGIELHTLRFAAALEGMTEKLTAVAFQTNGQTIYTACVDGTVRGYSAANGQQAFSANHGAAVHDLALSPDGQRLASAGADKLIKLINAADGQPAQLAQLAGFEAAVQRVCFSPDNTRVIGGSATGELLIFNVATAAGGFEQSVVGHTNAIAALVAGDGTEQPVFSASADGSVLRSRILAAAQLAGHTQPVTSLATIPGQPRQILSGSTDGTVRRWNVADGQQLSQLAHGGPVTAVAVRGDGLRFASASSNKTAKLWNAAAGQQLAEMRGDLRAKSRVAKLTQQKAAATAKVAATKTAVETAEKDVPVKAIADKTATDALAAAQKDVQAKMTAMSTTATTKSTAENTAIQAAAAAQKATQEMGRASQLALALSEKARLLAEKAAQAQAAAAAEPNNTALAQAAAAASQTAGAADAEAKSAESAKAAPTQAATTAAQAAATAATQAIAMTKPFNDAATALTQSQAAERAAQQAREIAARDLKWAQDAVPAAKAEQDKAAATLAQLDTDLTAATTAAADAEQPFHAIAFSPDGRSVVTGGDFGAVHSWDAENGKAVSSYVGHGGPVLAVDFVSARELVSGSQDKTAVVWDLNPNWQLDRVIGDINDPSLLVDRVAALDFSDDGRLLATGGGVPSRSGEVKIWNVADGSLLRSIPEPHTDGVTSVAFSPDGEFLASASADKYVKKLSVATGESLLQFEGHTNYVLGVSWRAGGQVLSSCGADGAIQIWNAVTGDRVRKIEGYQKQITSLRFVGQSQFIVSASGDRIVRMHNSDNGGVQRNFPGAAEYMYAIDVTPDPANGVLVAGGHDSVLRIWNTANAQVLHELLPPVEEPASEATAEARAEAN